MTPAARTQAAIDLLDMVIGSARSGGAAADALAQRFFAARRYAGSKDRRAIRSLVYRAIRLFGDAPMHGRSAIVAIADGDADLAATFDGSTYGPAPITPDEPRAVRSLVPAWIEGRLEAASIGQKDIVALLERAPIDLRVNRLRTTVEEARAGIAGEVLDDLPDAIRLPADTPVDRSPLVTNGAVEVQDAGSQIVSIAVGAVPGGTAIDLCAGAGGKTLALATHMANHGRIVSADTDRGRLSRLMPRAQRAGVSIVETRLLNPDHELEMLADLKASADWVMVDAPCSGTGTWRRNPEARWRLTPERLDRLCRTQSRLLDVASELVGPTGTITYVVCSLLDEEGRGQVDAFLERHSDWTALPLALPRGSVHGPGMRLTPASHATDGFFVARLARR